MSKKQDQVYNMLMAQIAQMNAPKPISPAQQRLDEQSLKGSDWLKSRDFRNMKDSGIFFNFDQPAEQAKRRNLITNANQGGTFGLADTAGGTMADKLQGKYLADRAARDDAQNFQNNVAQGAQGVLGGLAQSSNAAAGADARDIQTKNAILSALTSAYGKPKDQNSWLGPLLGAGATAASAF